MEVPVGPISNLVPPKYHTHLHKRILNSLIVASEKSAKRLREIAVNVPVIVQEKTTEVYSHVLQNLTSLGQQAVAQINPWIINVLIDWDNFDKVICISPLPGTDETFNEHENDDENNDDNEDDKFNHAAILPAIPFSNSHSVDTDENFRWTTQSTKLLISQYKENQQSFLKAVKKMVVWKKIAEK
ncbi:uncharacterized protein LOC117340452 [Pecten maximus]|uniref:uncharacterized protein LOC117340452 n=1 Tax=Pecten maximus TaxID=6579 RepID=UPI0014590CA1|nr:uncharacterized protein LOC117340452 [Pecten maximus]